MLLQGARRLAVSRIARRPRAFSAEASEAAPVRRQSRAARRAYLAQLRDRRDDLEARLGSPALAVAALVERTPVVMPDPEDWELEMWELQARLEQHDGFDYPEMVHNAAAGGRGAPPPAEPKPIPEEILALANRETDADRRSDVRSLERRLADSLYLVVKPTADAAWNLPRVDLVEDEAVRDAAERVLADVCGGELYAYVLGAAPVGVWDAEAGETLDRCFVAKAIVVDLYESGNVEESLVADYAWVAKDEIADYVTGDDEYLEYLGKLL